MVQPDAVEAAIQQVIPDANVTVEDLTGGGDHLQVTVAVSYTHLTLPTSSWV